MPFVDLYKWHFTFLLKFTCAFSSLLTAHLLLIGTVDPFPLTLSIKGPEDVVEEIMYVLSMVCWSLSTKADNAGSRPLLPPIPARRWVLRDSS